MEYEDHKKWAIIAFKWAATPVIAWILYRHIWPVSELALHVAI